MNSIMANQAEHSQSNPGLMAGWDERDQIAYLRARVLGHPTEVKDLPMSYYPQAPELYQFPFALFPVSHLCERELNLRRLVFCYVSDSQWESEAKAIAISLPDFYLPTVHLQRDRLTRNLFETRFWNTDLSTSTCYTHFIPDVPL